MWNNYTRDIRHSQDKANLTKSKGRKDDLQDSISEIPFILDSAD